VKFKPDPGWQQLQRERFDLTPQDRLPSAARVQAFGDLMPEVLKGMGLESMSRLSELQPRWAEIVGAANARQSRPGRWENGVLVIYVRHNVWLAEMKRFGAQAILKRVRAQFGLDAVRELRFQIDPGDDV